MTVKVDGVEYRKGKAIDPHNPTYLYVWLNCIRPQEEHVLEISVDEGDSELKFNRFGMYYHKPAAE